MICLRCGQCCTTHWVVIVDDPDKGPVDDNLICREDGKPCKHLLGDKMGEYSCAVHDKPWYKKTPCFSHGQIEQTDSPCRLGEYLLNKEKEATNG